MNSSDVKKDENREGPEGPEFVIQSLYIRDVSLETPNSPSIFLEEWDPKMELDLETQSNQLEKEIHEVVLRITVTVRLKEKVAFLVELKQAGIFKLRGFPSDQQRSVLGSFCPTILYPYARAAITDLVVKAGFPQLYLSPVNFDALLAEHDRKKSSDENKAAHTVSHGEEHSKNGGNGGQGTIH